MSHFLTLTQTGCRRFFPNDGVHRIATLAFLACGVLVLPTLCAAGSNAWSSEKPNVVLIMTDDQGWGDVRLHDNPAIDTPHLDDLAKAGARFDRFYVSSVCAPTRAGLLTGRYHLRTGTHGVTRGMENMRSEEVTIAELLRDAGYATACFGKWHNGAHYPMDPNGQGFDEFLGFCAGHWNNYFDTRLQHNDKFVQPQGFIIDVLTSAGIKFIEENKDQPFFCYLSFNTPHTPWQVPDRYWDKYQKRDLPETTRCAYAMCENIDDNVGRVLQALDRLKIAENTIVLFLTDNGANTDRWDGDMRGRKGSVHEGGVRVPLFVRYPNKVKAGTFIKPLAANIDLLPTIADFCGVSTEATLPLDGVSLVPLLTKESPEWPERTLFTFRGKGEKGAVRTMRWRATFEDKRRGWQLFDMQNDPSQKVNVANEHPQVVEQLAKEFGSIKADCTQGGLSPLPIPVGHEPRPVVRLPGHEAQFHPGKGSGIRYFGPSGWANDWVAHWTSADSYPIWEIDVATAGQYDVSLQYACQPESVGTRLKVQVGDASTTGQVNKAHRGERIGSIDRIGRKEVEERTWGLLEVGPIDLAKGRQQLKVIAVAKPGKEVIDLKAVILHRIK